MMRATKKQTPKQTMCTSAPNSSSSSRRPATYRSARTQDKLRGGHNGACGESGVLCMYIHAVHTFTLLTCRGLSARAGGLLRLILRRTSWADFVGLDSRSACCASACCATAASILPGGETSRPSPQAFGYTQTPKELSWCCCCCRRRTQQQVAASSTTPPQQYNIQIKCVLILLSAGAADASACFGRGPP